MLFPRIVWTLAATALALAQRPRATGTDWPTYNHDLAGTRYSPLKQISPANVTKLKLAWQYKVGPNQPNGGITGGSEFTPLVINGRMYVALAKSVVALEPETGKELWRFDVVTGVPSRRNVAYWPGDGNNPARIILSTGRNLVALNAATGKLDPGFGKEGSVDMVVSYLSAPTVYKNVLIVGANVGEAPATGQPGNTRAYDARTGAKLWEFHTVPQPGEPGSETWEGSSGKDRQGANNWGFSMTVDERRGIVYTVLGSPASDYYGGDRKGANLYGTSLVALDAQTGKKLWHFQAVHHDLWDYDLTSPPGLMDLRVAGKLVPVVALATKSGYMYILDRVTGKPVFGVEERPIPPSDVPGEQTSPTQPIPLKPPPLARHEYTASDIVTAAETNEEHAKFCADLAARSGGFYNAGPFTNYLYRAPGAAPKSTILFPGSVGGVNWGGTAQDPGLGYFFVNTMEEASIGWIEPKDETANVRYNRNSIVGPTSRFQWAEGNPRFGNILNSGEHAWPCQKPPWGNLIAVNAKTGDIAWKVPLGITDDLPEGKKNTGRLNFGGPIATAGGLVFIAATNDRRFRAFDSKSGKELWTYQLEASAHAVPITYQGKDGKQYVALVATGGNAIDEAPKAGAEALVVFALE